MGFKAFSSVSSSRSGIEAKNSEDSSSTWRVGKSPQRDFGFAGSLKGGPKSPQSPRRSRFSTEQVLPRRKGSCSSEASDLSNLNKEALNEDMMLRVLLLSPPPSDSEDDDAGCVQDGVPIEAPSCEKSTIEAYSHNGSVTVELIRLAGAEGHHFRLYVTSCEESVHVLLPSEFRGALFISHARSQMPASVEYGAGLQRRIDGGAVRINPVVGHGAVAEDEDEMHLYAAKRIVVETKDEETDLQATAARPLWVLEGRASRLRRVWLKFMP
ncbi:unnamed protein product [Cyclocybe aegerita]|uniref:DUF7330 domain-containing protein n=1 Tax=Cyclocybe aegerita TaxID=1973307 RepID=A0A8S0W704_CYCAE|nr:unnamed protein product [Cyclocybe aegerita]